MSAIAPVEFQVLGPFRIAVDGQLLSDIATDKARALLAYLALEGTQPRTTLTALLWPYLSQEAAFNNLRKTLHRLRLRLAESSPHAAELVIASRETVQLDPQRTSVDALYFQTLLAESDLHPHTSLATCDACLARLTQAVDLYQGELLEGFGLGDAPAFEEWLLLRREILHQQVLLAVANLATAWEARGEIARAHTYASRSLTLDPYREEAHRRQMRLLVRLGLPNQALQQYESWRRLLRDELGVEPDKATLVLYDQIRREALPREDSPAGDGEQPMAIPANQPSTAAKGAPAEAINSLDWGATPETGRVYGRQAELTQLKQWLNQERCQLVALLGIGGVGKTTLAATLAKALAPGFDKVIWRSLLNAPPLDELLRGVLPKIAQQPLAELPTSLDEQLTLLLHELRQQRCLLVLDNLESILQAEGFGQMRAGYEGYAQLMRQLAESRHNSCLLLTSRERPQGMARWEEDLSWVRSLRLEGLDATAGQAMLKARGLSGQMNDVHALVQRYSGHPLALKLVAETVQELFGGAIDDFLQEAAPIFDDIRAMLDAQFERLSPLEQELLFWLAIEREPVAAATLRDDLVQKETARTFLEALRSLQRRSLLESVANLFTLQNVVIEYVTERLIESICTELLAEGHGARAENLAFSFLNRFALLKAQAKEYVRQSQVRLILQPLAERLQMRLGVQKLQERLHALLQKLRSQVPRPPGYAAGNILNLVLHLGFDTAQYDFSGLNVWQADLRELEFATLNLAHADLSHSAFMLTFDLGLVKFSASGQILVAGIVDGDICLWHAVDGQLHHTFRGPGNRASYPLAISQDEKLLASSGLDHALRVWSVESGERLFTIQGHTDNLYGMTFSEDGQLLASSSFDGTVRVWDLQNGHPLHTLREHADAVNALAFTPDGAILAGGGGERLICLWDLRNGQVIRTLPGHAREIECLAFSAGGELLVSGAHDGTISLWDVARGQQVRTFQGHTQIVRTVALHADGHLLASGGADRLVRLWELHSGQLLHTLFGHTNEVEALSFSPDGHLLASGAKDNIAQQWDIRTGRALDSLKGRATTVRSVRFTPDGRRLVSGCADGLVRLWNLWPQSSSAAPYDKRVQYLHGHVGDIRSVACSPDGRLVASGGVDNALHLWDVETGKAIRTLHGHTNTIKAVAFSPDGRLLASGASDRTIRFWPVEEGATQTGRSSLVLHGHEDDISALAFSHDGRTLVSSSLDHTARLWSIDAPIETGQEMRVWRGHPYALSGAVFSPDGRYVVTTSYDYSVHLWDVNSGQPLERWRDHAVKALVVAFHPAGQFIACVTVERTIEIRNFDTGALLHTLIGHTTPVLSVDFNPTDPILASSDWDGTIKIWDLDRGVCLDTLRSPGPYAGLNISGVTGITEAQRAALMTLGAIEEERVNFPQS